MTFKIKIRTKVNKQWKWNKIRHFSMGHIQIWRHIIFNQKMLKHFNGFPNRTCSVLSLKFFSTGHNQIWRHIFFWSKNIKVFQWLSTSIFLSFMTKANPKNGNETKSDIFHGTNPNLISFFNEKWRKNVLRFLFGHI